MEVKAKKSLGQNFLRDDKIIDKIIESADLNADDIVVEVGPGEGVLTEKLAKFCKKVIAIELDDRLIDSLKNKFSKNNPPVGGVEIIHSDILKINFQNLITDYGLPVTGYKVVANLPYYITSPILRYFLENEIPPKEMIVMVQKEVAERITASAGKMSILAVSVQYYAEAEYLFTVGRQSFEPAPKVDSAVIKISSISSSLSGLPAGEAGRGPASTRKTIARRCEAGVRATGEGACSDDTKKFFRIVKAGFSAKRKTLANNLSNSLHRDKKEIENILSQLGFLPTVRAQELAVEDWMELASLLY